MNNIRKRRKKSLQVGLVLCFLIVLIVALGLNTGSLKIGPLEVIRTLIGYGTPMYEMVLFEYRMPRIIITILAGMGLGISGAIFQGITRNPLADPGVLGIHAGASLGLIVYVTYFTSLNTIPALLIPLFTFMGGCLAATLIFLLASEKGKGLLPTRLLLVGIAIAAGFNAMSLYLSLQLDETTYSFTASWLLGNVWGRDWINVYALLPWMLILIPLAFMKARSLNSFALGDTLAMGIGTSVNKERIQLLCIAVALSCASVSMAGGIGFVGLVAPHIARRLVGPMHQYVLPISALTGVIIVVFADTVARSLFEPNAIPAGVVVAAIGAPYFLYLLFRRK